MYISKPYFVYMYTISKSSIVDVLFVINKNLNCRQHMFLKFDGKNIIECF